MPIYEYECPSCGHRIEAIQQLGDPALTDCPACSKADLRRLVSAAGFRLKGSGWYATDFKDKPKTKPTTEQSEGGTKKPTDGGAPAAESKKPTDGGAPAAETKKPEQPSTASE